MKVQVKAQIQNFDKLETFLNKLSYQSFKFLKQKEEVYKKDQETVSIIHEAQSFDVVSITSNIGEQAILFLNYNLPNITFCKDTIRFIDSTNQVSSDFTESQIELIKKVALKNYEKENIILKRIFHFLTGFTDLKLPLNFTIESFASGVDTLYLRIEADTNYEDLYNSTHNFIHNLLKTLDAFNIQHSDWSPKISEKDSFYKSAKFLVDAAALKLFKNSKIEKAFIQKTQKYVLDQTGTSTNLITKYIIPIEYISSGIDFLKSKTYTFSEENCLLFIEDAKGCEPVNNQVFSFLLKSFSDYFYIGEFKNIIELECTQNSKTFKLIISKKENQDNFEVEASINCTKENQLEMQKALDTFILETLEVSPIDFKESSAPKNLLEASLIHFLDNRLQTIKQLKEECLENTRHSDKTFKQIRKLIYEHVKTLLDSIRAAYPENSPSFEATEKLYEDYCKAISNEILKGAPVKRASLNATRIFNDVRTMV